MKRILIIIAPIILILMMVACNSDDDLTPSDPEQSDFPQGTSDYDKEFEDFFKEYGTQVLYKFSENDFRWNVTSYLPFYANEADTAYIRDAWKFIKDNCLSIWSEDFLKKCLPYHLLLASKIYSNSVQYVTTDASGDYVKDTIQVPKNAMYGLNHITFGMVNSQIEHLTTDEKKQLIGDMAFALIGYATSKGILVIPDEFKTLHDKYISHNGESLAYGYGGWGYNGAGCLEYEEDIDYYYDFGLYVKYLVINSKQEFADKYLNDQFDCGTDSTAIDPQTQQTVYVLDHRVRNKYNIVVDYFKNTLNIDLQAIGDSISKIK
ncbi:MAG: hypothetical protein LKG14_03480 [Prevotella sp.]|nr:hypothetical protein [uncultured Prevotella sp.]MCI1246434.1 hypothetical protein [Prevotella sp.]